MNATTTAGTLDQSGALLRYPGWRMVFIGVICMMITFGIPISVLPLVYTEVMKEFGWTMSQATFAFSLKQWTMALLALLVVAPFVEKFGLRAMMITSCVVTGAAMVSFLFIASIWSYNLAVLSLGFGQAFTIIGVKILISRWFTRRQGVAVGVALAGSSFGGAIFPLLFAGLAQAYGWRMAMAGLSLSIWLIVLPAYLLIARENPTEEDIAPEAIKGDASMAARMLKQADNGPNIRQILSHPAFWCAGIGIALISGVDGGMFQHTALYVENDLHFGKGAAAGAISVMFALGVVAKIGAGWVFDRLSIRGVQLWWAMVVVAVLMAFTVQGAATLAIFVLVRGLAHGGLVADSPIIAKHSYGPKELNKVLPFFTFFLGLGGGLGPLLLAMSHDRYHSYTIGFIVTALCGLVAVGLLSFVPPTFRNQILKIKQTS
jgi:MFS family permease